MSLDPRMPRPPGERTSACGCTKEAFAQHAYRGPRVPMHVKKKAAVRIFGYPRHTLLHGINFRSRFVAVAHAAIARRETATDATTARESASRLSFDGNVFKIPAMRIPSHRRCTLLPDWPRSICRPAHLAIEQTLMRWCMVYSHYIRALRMDTVSPPPVTGPPAFFRSLRCWKRHRQRGRRMLSTSHSHPLIHVAARFE